MPDGRLILGSSFWKLLGRYGLMGLFGTFAHYLILVFAVVFLHLDAVASSVLGALAGAVINYILNYHFTFSSAAPHISTSTKFLIVTGIGFVVNAGIMALATKQLHLNFLVGQVIATAVVFVLGYVLNRSWTFFEGRTDRGGVIANSQISIAGSNRPGFQVWFNVALVLFVVSVGYAVFEGRSLFADGVRFFLQVLEHETVFRGGDRTRWLANLLTQAPLLAGIHLGVTDVSILEPLYGFGLYLPYFIMLAVWWVTTKDRPHYRIFPLLLLYASAANSSMFIVSESHVASALFFALLPLFVFRETWNASTSLVAILLAAPLLLSYQSVLFYAVILIALALWRWRNCTQPGFRWLWLLFALWFLACGVLAVSQLLWPHEGTSAHVGGFTDHVRLLFVDHMLSVFWGNTYLHFEAAFSIIALLLLAYLYFRPSQALDTRILSFGFGLATCLMISLMLVFPAQGSVPFQYAARVLQVPIPIGLALVCIVMARGLFDVRRFVRTSAISILMSLVVLQTFSSLKHSYQWAGFRAVFVQTLNSHQGLVNLHSTPLVEYRVGRQPLQAFHWTWVVAELSILFSPEGKVATIIAKPDRTRPFDPRHSESLPELRRYGIDYDRYISALNKPGQQN